MSRTERMAGKARRKQVWVRHIVDSFEKSTIYNPCSSPTIRTADRAGADIEMDI